MDPVIILTVVTAILALAVIFLVLRAEKGRAETAARIDQLARAAESAQAALGGRLDQSQSGINDRLEALSKRFGDGLAQQTEKTGETLVKLNERLAVIDAAQKEITDLSKEVVGLQDILSNKQARGAFGEIQLNDLVADVLPPSAYAFQVTLSNGKIADCLINLPNPPGAIVVDSKFPLEGFRALRAAATDEENKAAERLFRDSVRKHIKDISSRYIINGETAESALMFLPSEAIYAELHANHQNVIDESFRAKVFIVSPTTLWATLNTVRAILKDAKLQEKAGLIQKQVHILLTDIGRLGERTAQLKKQFKTASERIDEIQTSSDKIASHSRKIEEIQLGEEPTADGIAPPPLRIVDGE